MREVLSMPNVGESAPLKRMRGSFGGLDMTETPLSDALSSAVNLNTSCLPVLQGYGKSLDCSVHSSGAALQLYMFGVMDKMYLLAFDGAYITLYCVTKSGYELVYTFPDTFTTSEALNAVKCILFCGANYGSTRGRRVLIYPLGQCATIDEETASLTDFHSLTGFSDQYGFLSALVHKNRLFATTGYTLYASSPESLVDFLPDNDAGDDENAPWASKVTDEKEGEVPILGLAQLDGRLYYFCRGSFGEVRGDTNPFRIEHLYSVGTVNMESVRVLDGKLYFLSEEGLMAFDGQKPERVSDSLGITSFSDGVGGVWQGQYYLGIKQDGVSKVYTYCPTNDSWGNLNITGELVMFAANDLGLYYLCESDGRYCIYKISGEPDGWQCVTVPQTNDTLAERKLMLARVSAYLQEGDSLTVTLRVFRKDGSMTELPIIGKVSGNGKEILSRRLAEIRGVAFGLSIRATGGARVFGYELLYVESGGGG